MTADARTPIRLGTRRSALARVQSEWVAEQVRRTSGLAVELVEVVTEGDVNQAPLTSLGGTGVFVSALRDALRSGAVDLAVHSLKDLPTDAADGLTIAAVPRRADARDALVARGASLASLPVGATVGTGSPRRAAQLRLARPDLSVVDLRGNVDTRLRAVSDGALDAVVLAVAGLVRLDRADAIDEILDPEVMLPAPGQGALAVETRTSVLDADDPRRTALLTSLRSLDDATTRACVTAERAVLSALEAGCAAPVGALADVDHSGTGDPGLRLRAFLAGGEGQAAMRMSITAPADQADTAGRQLAARLLERLGVDVLGERAT
jgi:hydroxymethylbilane synthase